MNAPMGGHGWGLEGRLSTGGRWVMLCLAAMMLPALATPGQPTLKRWQPKSLVQRGLTLEYFERTPCPRPRHGPVLLIPGMNGNARSWQRWHLASLLSLGWSDGRC